MEAHARDTPLRVWLRRIVGAGLLILSVPGYFTDALWWGNVLSGVGWPIVATVAGLVLLTADLWWPTRLRGEPRDPLENGLLDAQHAGERLQKRLRSGDPPNFEKVGESAAGVIERLHQDDEHGLADRFYGNDGVQPPHDADAHADYMQRRLRELRAILRSVRGRG
jgi:hypothetical protein